MNNTHYPKARTKNLVIQTLQGETLIYDVAIHEAHCLNETAGLVWSLCDGNNSVDEIAIAIQTKFGEPVDADLVRLAITQLNERKLLTGPSFDASTMPNRREAIRRIGLASAVATPIIASIVAPTSVLANISCACSSSAACLGMAGRECLPNALVCNPSGICVPG
jgi:hypothetical protein